DVMSELGAKVGVVVARRARRAAVHRQRASFKAMSRNLRFDLLAGVIEPGEVMEAQRKSRGRQNLTVEPDIALQRLDDLDLGVTDIGECDVTNCGAAGAGLIAQPRQPRELVCAMGPRALLQGALE